MSGHHLQTQYTIATEYQWKCWICDTSESPECPRMVIRGFFSKWMDAIYLTIGPCITRKRLNIYMKRSISLKQSREQHFAEKWKPSERDVSMRCWVKGVYIHFGCDKERQCSISWEGLYQIGFVEEINTYLWHDVALVELYLSRRCRCALQPCKTKAAGGDTGLWRAKFCETRFHIRLIAIRTASAKFKTPDYIIDYISRTAWEKMLWTITLTCKQYGQVSTQ